MSTRVPLGSETTPPLGPTDAVATTAAGETFTVATADFPSIVAVSVDAPVASARTSPVLEMVATAAFELTHTGVRPDTVLPSASRADAVIRLESPTESVTVLIDSATLATCCALGVTVVGPSRSALVHAPIVMHAMARISASILRRRWIAFR